MLGTDFARTYFISDAILAGFARHTGVALSPAYAPMGHGWHAWTTPRHVNFTDQTVGLKSQGTLWELTYGLDYRVRPDLIVGFAFSPEQTKVSFEGLNASLYQTGIGGGPYVGWRIRPTTIFDAWLGYVRLDRAFDVFGHGANMPVDRMFLSTSLTEIIETPWMRVLPRFTVFHARDEVRTVTSSQGFSIPGQTYSWGHVEGSLELNRDLALGLLLQPFVRATLRYDTERIVDVVTRLDGTDIELNRWHGQLRGGVRARLGSQAELWLSGGYLSFFTPDIDVWEAKAHFRLRFDEATSAFAADLPVKAPPPPMLYSWTGCSVGVNAGHGWAKAEFDSAPNDAIIAFAQNNGILPQIAAQQAASGTTHHTGGLTAGVGVSCNAQFDKAVVGLETDINFSDFQSSELRGPFPLTPGVSATWENSFRSNYFGTVRGRLGLLANPWSLVYVTGGLAYADFDFSTATDFPGFTGFRFEGSDSRVKLGWTAGFGWEAVVSGPWTAKIEYLYADLGDRTAPAPQNVLISPFAWTHSARLTENIVRVGLSYKFAGPPSSGRGWLSQ